MLLSCRGRQKDGKCKENHKVLYEEESLNMTQFPSLLVPQRSNIIFFRCLFLNFLFAKKNTAMTEICFVIKSFSELIKFYIQDLLNLTNFLTNSFLTSLQTKHCAATCVTELFNVPDSQRHINRRKGILGKSCSHKFSTYSI